MFSTGIGALVVRAQALDVSANFLTEIHELYGLLGNLQRLVAHSNAITTIHDNICECKKLEHLEVQHNQVIGSFLGCFSA